MICHISSLASVYHKPPSAFVEGRGMGLRKSLPNKSEIPTDTATVIPSQESLVGDLLSMDINSPIATNTHPKIDLLGGGLDTLVSK